MEDCSGGKDMLGKKRTYSQPSEMAVARINRLLDEMKYRNMDIQEAPTVEAIVCDDCVVILDWREDGSRFTLLDKVHKLNFSMNLTPKEMQDFNGGTEGLRQRFFPVGGSKCKK